MIGKQTISKVSKTLEEGLAKELRDQGHYLTGELERSITSRENSTANGEDLEISALDYIDDLDQGKRPEHIDESDIAGLTRYAQLRFGYSGDQAVKAAVAIARKHRREGMPTKNSYVYSSTGERKFVIEETYDRNIGLFDQQIEDGLSNELDSFIDKTLDQTIF